jgi:hypothetical protein
MAKPVRMTEPDLLGDGGPTCLTAPILRSATAS